MPRVEKSQLVHNEQVKLTVNFLGKIGSISIIGGLLPLLFAANITKGMMILSAVLVIGGLASIYAGFRYIRTLR